MFQIQELQDKVNSLNDTGKFYDSETASSSGLSHVPLQPLSIPSPRGMVSRDSCLIHGTHFGLSRNFLEDLLAPESTSSSFLSKIREVWHEHHATQYEGNL